MFDLENGGLVVEGGLFLRLETGNLDDPDGVRSGVGVSGLREVSGVLNCGREVGFAPAKSLCDLLWLLFNFEGNGLPCCVTPPPLRYQSVGEAGSASVCDRLS